MFNFLRKSAKKLLALRTASKARRHPLTNLAKRTLPCGSLSVLIFVLGISLPHTAYAAEGDFQSFLQTWGSFLALIGSLLNVIIWVVLGFITDLLANDFIFGNGMENMLLAIWQVVRNFVNLAFVFALLVVAFYNIVSIDPDKIPLKKSLGKIAIALILVNFSYFGAKVVLDVANILTTAVFAIPRDIINETGMGTADDDLNAICYKRVFLDETGTDAATPEESVAATDEFLEQNNLFGTIQAEPGSGRNFVVLPTKCFIPNLVKVQLYKQGEALADGVSVAEFDKMKVLLYYHETPDKQPDDQGYKAPLDLNALETQLKSGGISVEDFNQQIDAAKLTKEKFNKGTIIMVIAKTMFDLNKLSEVSAASGDGFLGLTISGIVNLIMLLVYGVMFVAMFLILLFRVVYLWICIAFSPLVALMFVFKDFGIELGEFDIQKIFLQYAFVPVKMGVALSVGVLMVFKANQALVSGKNDTELGELALDKATYDIPIDTIFSDDLSIQKLMWQIATVAVVWIAIKWSMKDLSGPVNGLVEGITGYVDSIAGLAAKVPLVLPIAPFSEVKGEESWLPKNVGQLINFPHMLGNALQTKIDMAGRGGSIADAVAIKEMLDRVNEKDKTGGKDILKDLVKNDTYMQTVYNDVNLRQQFAEKLKVAGVVTENQYETFMGSGKTEKGFGEMLKSASKDSTKEPFVKEVFGAKNDGDVEELLEKWKQGESAGDEESSAASAATPTPDGVSALSGLSGAAKTKLTNDNINTVAQLKALSDGDLKNKYKLSQTEVNYVKSLSSPSASPPPAQPPASQPPLTSSQLP